jgi:hypothetical protein
MDSLSMLKGESTFPLDGISRMVLQENLCWCNALAALRAPVQDECEMYLIATFGKIVESNSPQKCNKCLQAKIHYQ